MNYKKIYSDRETEELVKNVTQSDVLSYGAKVSIVEILKKRQHEPLDDPNYQSVLSEINEENQRISSLMYLNNLGFEKVDRNDGWEIGRTTTATVIDLIGVFVGVLLSLSWIATFMYVREVWATEMEILKLIGITVTAAVGVLGLMLIFRSVSRLFEYHAFKIVKSDSEIIVYSSDQPNSGLKLRSIDFSVEESSEEVQLMYRYDGNFYKLIGGEVNPRIRRTLHELKLQLDAV